VWLDGASGTLIHLRLEMVNQVQKPLDLQCRQLSGIQDFYT
jgi:hypothetical protein